MKTIKVKVDLTADNLFSQARGLMFRSKPVTILFKFDKDDIYSIHSWFVFFPFDIVYLDKGMRAVEIYKNVPSYSYLKPKRPARNFLELPPGGADRLGINLGDKIEVSAPHL